MNKFFKLKKLILQTLFLYIFLLTSSSMGFEKYYRGDSVSNYFSGIISLQDYNYRDSYNFFKNLENLEDNHLRYSKSYIESLVNNSKINDFAESEEFSKIYCAATPASPWIIIVSESLSPKFLRCLLISLLGKIIV